MNELDNIQIEESKKLDQTTALVKEKKDTLEKEIVSLGAVNLDTLKKLRQDSQAGIDLIFALQKLHEANESYNLPDKYAQLEELMYAIDEPYFARIDIKEHDSTKADQIYIGKFGIAYKNNPIVVDWRTRIAAIYYKYRYPQKNVEYNTENGPVKADLMLKRTFEIDKGQLIKYYNNDIQFDESTIISNKIKERTGGTLEDIIETIQENQLEIIESDPRQTCIVQGCVGSGKSTVAIHKLAYLFFNYAQIIKAQRSILIAKNQILVSYLSTLFPKLGIFDINYKTIKDLLVQIIYKEKLNIKFDFREDDNLQKFNLDVINSIKKDFLVLQDKYSSQITDIFIKREFESFGGFVYNKNDAISQNIKELESELLEEVALQKEYSKETANPARKDLHRDNIKQIRKILTHISKIKLSLKSDFEKLLKKYKIQATAKLNYANSLIYTYFYHELFGFENFLKYEYCVVDEGQDFSLLEYLVLSKFVLNGRFCILGDLNQSYDVSGLTSWQDISQVILEAKSAKLYELNTNYRSTKNIIEFANNILRPYTNDYLPIPIERYGKDPAILSKNTTKETLEHLNNELLNDIENLDKSVGIIIADPKMYAFVEEALPETVKQSDKYINLNDQKHIRYIPKGIYLADFNDCKGLEFSKVYIIGLNILDISNFKEAKSAFVAVTRAMNELVIFEKTE